MSTIESFFADLDRQWPLADTAPVPLHLIGSTALMLQTSYARNTKDGDVLEGSGLRGDAKPKLLAVAGKGTPLHQRHGMFLDIVMEALPFLPQRPVWHLVPGVAAQHFQLYALDIVDVVVSKLARLHQDDVRDVAAMVELGNVPTTA